LWARPAHRITAVLLGSLLLLSGCSSGTRSATPTGTSVPSAASETTSNSLAAQVPTSTLEDVKASAARVHDYLASDDGRLIVLFRELVKPLWALGQYPRDQWVATCRNVGAALNQSVDVVKLGSASAPFPDAQGAELLLDERTLTSQLLIACNQGDLEAAASFTVQGGAVEQRLAVLIGASS
jgi:hypothetical protein